MMLGDFDLRRVATCPVSRWLEAVESVPDGSWGEMEYRQNRRTRRGQPGVHTDTSTLPVLWAMPPEFNRIRAADEVPQHHGDLFTRPLDDLRVVFEQVYGPGWMLRCIVVRLPAGGRIPIHRDNGGSFEVSHRCHIPIVTNPAVAFQVGATAVHMSIGEVWEINNFRRHRVTNSGQADRLHVIADWHPETGDPLAYASK